MVDQNGTRRRGRPRDDTIDKACYEAVLALLLEDGVRGLTLDAVARRAGTTPPALYRRWSGVEALLWEAVQRELLDSAKRDDFSGPYSIDGLPLGQAVLQATRRCAEILSDTRLVACMTAIASAATADPLLKAAFKAHQEEWMVGLARLVAPVAETAGIAPRVIASMITGPIFHNAILGAPSLSPAEIEAIARVVVAGCEALAGK